MKETIIVDADVIISYLKTGGGKLTQAYEKYAMKVTPLTYTEILASSTFADSKLESDVKSFLSEYFKVENVTEEISLKAAEIIRAKKEITLAHAFVAATALALQAPLLTDRDPLYEGIDGLKMVEV